MQNCAAMMDVAPIARKEEFVTDIARKVSTHRTTRQLDQTLFLLLFHIIK
jgi:hypothetical protein